MLPSVSFIFPLLRSHITYNKSQFSELLKGEQCFKFEEVIYNLPQLLRMLFSPVSQLIKIIY